MGKVKYSEEMNLQTVKYVLEGGKSANKISKELEEDQGIESHFFLWGKKKKDYSLWEILWWECEKLNALMSDGFNQSTVPSSYTKAVMF